MQQSPTMSTEQESSPRTISHYSSEPSLDKMNKLEKWRRITKRIVQFFRLIKVPILRLRFMEMISHISTDDSKFEGLNGYETKKIQEDFLFLDDIKRYQEVFNTFLSIGFVWQDKEFRLAKLKANYIYDHYMSTPEAIAKTNIPLDTIPFISNHINSPRIFSSLIYLNLFNDAEKFLIEKLLMIYMWKGLKCFSTLPEKQLMNRSKGNRIPNGSVSSTEHLKERNNTEKTISEYANIKLKIEPQYDEIIIPNWTYSTGLGVVYNPIREKRVKVIRRNVQKKRKDIDSTVNSMIKFNPNTANEMERFHSTCPKSVVPIPPKFRSPVNRPHIDHHAIHSISKDKSSLNSNRFPSSPYSRCDIDFNKNMFDKNRISQTVFICKVHSSSWSQPNHPMIKNKTPYRMASKPHFFNRQQQLCHKDQR